MTLFEEMGGAPAVERVICDFVGRMVNDVMIGFFFANVDREKLEMLEYEHAAEFLGAEVSYSGRTLRNAHAKHRIFGGHFDRRRELLRKTLLEHRVPDRVIEAWLAHVDSLRNEVTSDPDSRCL